MVEQMTDLGNDLQLSAVFGALADPTRRAIVRRLASGEATVGELAQPFAMSFQAVSKHLRVLEHAGLIKQGRRAQQRPCRLRPETLASATGWLGDFRQLWESSFDRLDDHLTKKKGSPQ
jgi:DNA-binding transcriptional ArsR family regulator